MPKQPSIESDRFRIYCEVDQEQVGGVIADLTRRGITQIGHEMITDVPTFKNSRRFETSATEALIEYLKQHPTFKVGDAVKHFAQEGRSASAIYSALKPLVASGVIRKVSEGIYQSTEVRALPAPDAAPKEKSKRGGAYKHYEISNRDLILNFIKNRKSISARQLTELFEENGRPSNSATSVLSKMTGEGVFKLLGDGKYEVVKNKKPGLNGAAAETSHAS